MKVLDLFSGIGGFSLGLDRAGFETVAFCEIEKYPRSVLKKHWPDVPVFEDVRKLNQESLKDVGIESIDVVCGGFPCQPFSVAGKQAGKEDDRHLWPEMLRIIKEVRPRWVIGENVAGFIPMALDDVLSDLEGEGYETQSFVIPACAVGGIHRRDRVWIVANSNRCANGKQYQREANSQSNDSKRAVHDMANTKYRRWSKRGEQARRQAGDEAHRCNGQVCDSMANTESGGSVKPSITKPVERQRNEPREKNIENALSDANDERLQGKSITKSNESVRTGSDDQQFAGCDGSQSFRPIEPPTQPPVRHRDDGLSDNVARLKALGNAVVPQIPEMIGRAIMEIEMSYTTIYKMGAEIEEVGDIRNAHRGAMYVWNQIAKKYFNQDYFPMFDEVLASKIWNAHDHVLLTSDEIIVLASTMDKATVNAKGLPDLIEAFEAYGQQHKSSSFLEQAELLRKVDLKDGDCIGWCQTSCGEFWGEGEFNEETEEYNCYDPNHGDIHFDVIEQFNELAAEKVEKAS